MKKLILAIVLLVALFVMPEGAMATEQVCTTSYGGGTVCGAKTHEPVEAGLAENLALVGGLSFGISAILQRLAQKANRN